MDERAFWIEIRRLLLAMVVAIEMRHQLRPNKRTLGQHSESEPDRVQ